MIAELGQFCLCLALLVALLQGAMPALAHALRPHRIYGWTRPLATLQFMLVSAAFAALFYCYVTSDFSVMNVLLNSHSSKPLLYKIVGVWGNHEGSMMLWAWILAAYGFAIAFLRVSEPALTHRALAVMGMVATGLLSFIAFTSNPFLRVWPTPGEGQDLNPLLQDIGLSFHPPVLYLGYVGFAVVFSFAAAGIMQRRIDRAWAQAVHPFIMLPWAMLTLGIGAGSWWAYRELGWGGFWFWDPVENVSLLPWLVGTALLHANMVLARRGQLGTWVALLSILAFAMGLVGTFIVRSGLITSVHSFASDPTRGLFILGYLVLSIGGALALYTARPLPTASPVRLASRSGLILIGNVLLVVMALSILIAILYPLFLTLAGLPSVSVGAPYFNRTILPLAAPLAVLAALAPLLPWDRFTRAQAQARLMALSPALAAAALLALAVTDQSLALAFAGFALAGWLGLGCVVALRRAARAQSLFTTLRGLRQLAGLLAHAGFAVFILGVSATCLLKETYEAPLVASKPLQFGQYELRLLEATRREERNYVTRRARFAVRRDGKTITTLAPELRYYPARAMQTTEVALFSTPLRDLYLVIGDAAGEAEDGQPGIGVRLMVTPGQQWVWLGFLLVGGGGLLAAATAFAQQRQRRG